MFFEARKLTSFSSTMNGHSSHSPTSPQSEVFGMNGNALVDVRLNDDGDIA